MNTGLTLWLSFKSLCFPMMPAFKRKKPHKVIVFHSRAGDLRASELTQIPLRPQAQNTDLQHQLSCDDTNSVTLQSLLNCGHKFAPLWRQGKPSGLAVSQAAISSWWSLPGSAAHPQQGSASVQTQSSSLEKVSKSRFWLCNYLFSPNCKFSCIIRPINIKFLLVLTRIWNDAVRSEKEGKWYPENPVGRKAMCCWVRGKPCRDFRLGVLCKPRTPLMTVTVCHYILKWHRGNYKLKFLLENHRCMDSSIEMAWGHSQTSCSNGKGSNLCWVQLFGKKKYYFINQPPLESTVLLSPQTVTTFCSSETLFLVCSCSWRGQGLALNKKEDLKHPLESCWSVTLEFRGKQGGL